MRTLRIVLLSLLLVVPAFAQKKNVPKNPSEKKPEATAQPTAPASTNPASEEATPEQKTPSDAKSAPPATPNTKYDMKEMAPVVTHHQITSASGKVLKYTATAGRLPIKDGIGNIEAEMFFVAYTLDGQEPSKRPVTFAFNGGPGSASFWLHMGALGPRKAVMQNNEGWMPQGPYRIADNPYTPLDQTDVVLIDAIGTGYSRPVDANTGKKFWGVKGDIEAFGEFIRMYISRYDRWSSPLFMLGESYGTTRAAGIAGYLVDRGIAFNGITLLSTIIDFQSVITTRRNDEAFALTLPTFTAIAWYHKKLPQDLQGDLAKARREAEAFALGEYTTALAKGDALTAEERSALLDKLVRYTGLKKDYLDQSNLRVDVEGFTANLLLDQRVRVGRLDGRYTGPNPAGTLDQSFYDPSSGATTPPFTAAFNDYIRRELNYKVDMPYYISARDGAYGDAFNWSWGLEFMGYTDTAAALRAAMIKNPYMKVQVMEGYYDLATPYFAVNYTMDHLDLMPQFRKNISFATYESGHMLYLHAPSLEKMHKDYTGFVTSNLPQ